MAPVCSADYGDAITPYGIAAPDAARADHERFPLVIDAEDAFSAAYGARGSFLYLIRPDGHVGDRAAPIDDARLRRHFGRVLIASPS
jgi:hypothetical protein